MRPASFIVAVFAGLVMQGNITSALPTAKWHSEPQYLEGRSATTEIEARDAYAAAEPIVNMDLDVRSTELEERGNNPVITTAIVLMCLRGFLEFSYKVYKDHTTDEQRRGHAKCIADKINKAFEKAHLKKRTSGPAVEIELSHATGELGAAANTVQTALTAGA